MRRTSGRSPGSTASSARPSNVVEQLDRFASAGCGYFLMNPIGDPADERDQIEAIAADILPRLASR